eukprot:g2252.t1
MKRVRRGSEVAVENTSVLLIRFTKQASDDVIAFFKDSIIKGGLLVADEEKHLGSGTTCLTITGTRDVLEDEAQHLGWLKATKDGIVDDFSVAGRNNFIGIRNSDFFSYAERAQLIKSKLEFIRVEEKETLDELGITYDYNSEASLLYILQSNALIDLISPVHDEVTRTELMWDTFKVGLGRSLFSPIESLRNYYGEEVAFYFLWIDFMTLWLLLPASIGILLYFLRLYNGDSIDDCVVTPFYGLFMFLWGCCFLRFFEQEEVRSAWKWGTYTRGVLDHTRSRLDKRPEFRGEIRISPITGRQEKYQSRTNKIGLYILSSVVTFVLLCGAFFIIVCSLNLQGYINPSHDRARWVYDGDHPFYIQFFAKYSEEGALFDASSNFASLCPVVIHVLVVLSMNFIYSHVAEVLTFWENHESKNSHENSLLLKRFCFEAFDAFTPLIYLCCYENDVTKLRSELVSVFNVDTFRRILCECIIPRAIQIMQINRSEEKDEKEEKKSLLSLDRQSLRAESMKVEYDTYDDYLEIMIEFGYIILFASAYPLAACIAVFANLIEVRSDALKLAQVCRKPPAKRVASIGMWKNIMKAIVILSACTNVYIFSFTSQQMMQWMPQFFFIAADGDQEIVEGSGRYVVLLAFLIERVMLLLGFLISVAIPTRPEEVEEMIKHRAYVLANEARSQRIAQLKKKQN